MIRTFRDKQTEKVFLRERSRKLSPDVQRIALRKLAMLDAAQAIQDLRVPPGNRLEKLSRDREGQYSIRINEIVHGMRSITADTALRLAMYFETTPSFWMNLQGRYDLEVEKDRLGRRLEKEIASFAASAR